MYCYLEASGNEGSGEAGFCPSTGPSERIIRYDSLGNGQL